MLFRAVMKCAPVVIAFAVRLFGRVASHCERIRALPGNAALRSARCSAEKWCCSFGGATIENFWTTARPFTKIVVITLGEKSCVIARRDEVKFLQI